MSALWEEPILRSVASPTVVRPPLGTEAAPPVLALQDVFKIYREGEIETVALRGASLSVGDGEMVAVVGPSGSGKSTLLGIAAGLTNPTAGRVLVDGRSVTAMAEEERARLRRRRIGLVFQRDNLIPFLSALENVEVALGAAAADGAERRARARELLGRVGMGHRLGHRPAQLSGGEQQRAAIAVALANEPGLLLADEPTGELDSATAEAVMTLLVELNRTSGTAVVLVTHNPRLARRATRVVRMLDGLLAPVDPDALADDATPAPAPVGGAPVADGEVVLAASGLGRTYPGGVHALRGVDLTVRAGETVAVVGPSGCGKSTLLHLAGGLDRPTTGEVVVAGQRLAALGAGARALVRRRTIGFVFQAHNLVATLTAAENVALPLILDGTAEPIWRPRALGLLGQVGLGEVGEKLPDQLSGGQRQRVAVARALAHRPRLLLADEPTGSLDRASAARMTELLVDLARAHALALVVVTHDPAVAARCDRAVELMDGRVIDGAGPPPAAEADHAGEGRE